MDNTEKLVSNFNKFISVCNKVSCPDAVSKLADQLGERMVLSPRGLTAVDGGVPGGLLSFSLEVASISKKMAGHFTNTRSLVRVALFHELGKLGDLNNEMYIPQESDWHREKLGQNCKYNDDCKKMTVSHRSIWLLHNFGFKLSEDEYLSILTSQGMHLEENRFYGRSSHENELITSLQASRGIVLGKHN